MAEASVPGVFTLRPFRITPQYFLVPHTVEVMMEAPSTRIPMISRSSVPMRPPEEVIDALVAEYFTTEGLEGLAEMSDAAAAMCMKAADRPHPAGEDAYGPRGLRVLLQRLRNGEIASVKRERGGGSPSSPHHDFHLPSWSWTLTRMLSPQCTPAFASGGAPTTTRPQRCYHSFFLPTPQLCDLPFLDEPLYAAVQPLRQPFGPAENDSSCEVPRDIILREEAMEYLSALSSTWLEESNGSCQRVLMKQRGELPLGVLALRTRLLERVKALHDSLSSVFSCFSVFFRPSLLRAWESQAVGASPAALSTTAVSFYFPFSSPFESPCPLLLPFDESDERAAGRPLDPLLAAPPQLRKADVLSSVPRRADFPTPRDEGETAADTSPEAHALLEEIACIADAIERILGNGWLQRAVRAAFQHHRCLAERKREEDRSEASMGGLISRMGERLIRISGARLFHLYQHERRRRELTANSLGIKRPREPHSPSLRSRRSPPPRPPRLRSGAAVLQEEKESEDVSAATLACSSCLSLSTTREVPSPSPPSPHSVDLLPLAITEYPHVWPSSRRPRTGDRCSKSEPDRPPRDPSPSCSPASSFVSSEQRERWEVLPPVLRLEAPPTRRSSLTTPLDDPAPLLEACLADLMGERPSASSLLPLDFLSSASLSHTRLSLPSPAGGFIRSHLPPFPPRTWKPPYEESERSLSRLTLFNFSNARLQQIGNRHPLAVPRAPKHVEGEELAAEADALWQTGGCAELAGKERIKERLGVPAWEREERLLQQQGRRVREGSSRTSLVYTATVHLLHFWLESFTRERLLLFHTYFYAALDGEACGPSMPLGRYEGESDEDPAGVRDGFKDREEVGFAEALYLQFGHASDSSLSAGVHSSYGSAAARLVDSALHAYRIAPLHPSSYLHQRLPFFRRPEVHSRLVADFEGSRSAGCQCLVRLAAWEVLRAFFEPPVSDVDKAALALLRPSWKVNDGELVLEKEHGWPVERGRMEAALLHLMAMISRTHPLFQNTL